MPLLRRGVGPLRSRVAYARPMVGGGRKIGWRARKVDKGDVAVAAPDESAEEDDNGH